MKAVLSNRIYLNVTEDYARYLLGKLTYEIDQQPISPYPLRIVNVERITDTAVSIPLGREDLIPKDYQIIDKRVFPEVVIPEPSFVPRESQQEAIDQIEGSGLVEAKVGWGKTIAGLGIAYKHQTKTLIICPTTTIRDMWIQEVNKFFPFKAGVIGGGKFQTDSPIVVANIQTLRNRVGDIASEFGLIIVDEVHRSPATTFTEVLNRFKAKYRVGLSGTMERKDGKHVVIRDYFGENKYVGVPENTMEPEIHMVDVEHELNANEFIPWAKQITDLLNNTNYRDTISNLAKLYAEAGHKVLVLADRTEFLEYCHLESPDNSVIMTGKQSSAEERKLIMQAIKDDHADILYGTQSIWSEGVSLNELSTVILATPIKNDPLLEQIIGRVMRKAEGKLDPVVIDIGLKGNTGKRQRMARTKFYVKMGWKIKNLLD